MPYVITCGDDGVQLNAGTRLGFVGAGVKLDGFEDIIPALIKVLGEDIVLAAHEENAWIRQALQLSTWEQADASAQQHTEALADRVGLKYAGFLPFADPRDLEHGVRGHMVRPREIHFATSVCFTLAGGEQKYNLGRYVISAEWLSQANPESAKKVLDAQIKFYQSLAGDNQLRFTTETEGPLDKDLVTQNQAALAKMGYLS